MTIFICYSDLFTNITNITNIRELICIDCDGAKLKNFSNEFINKLNVEKRETS